MYPTASRWALTGHEILARFSREVIADSIETVVAGCEGMDGVRRVRWLRQKYAGLPDGDRPPEPPGVFLSTAAPFKPGCFKDEDVDIVSVFEAIGETQRR